MNSGHWSFSFSSVWASVEYPDFVFLTPDGLNSRSSNSSARSCVGELRLRSSLPATSRSSAPSDSTSAVSRALIDRSVSVSTATPTCSILASTRTSGFSIEW